MTSALNLKHYLNNLENLPVELQRNFTLMRDLDSRVQELMRNIDKLTDDYMSNSKGYTADKNREMMTSIQRQFDKAKEYSDDKVQLSIQTYEMVDKHVREFDSDLARFGAEIQDRAISATRNIEENSQKRECKKIKDKEIKKKSASSEEETAPKKTSKKKQLKKGVTKTTSAAPNKTPLINVVTNPTNPTNSVTSVTVETSSLTGALVGAGGAHSAEVLDMPVDPNEPTYCLCNQVSYGEMIGCDNPDCPIEWFHFACVKLTTKPKGKWFCPKCITDRKKK
ncbi:inhibitor of growth protein 4-like [Rhopalosiphum padi]|uniref:inhibitor of growth protein 4-like n=1 Tax=Rhopalosiphum padi TaxID=40932 RepID=UPI00298E0664|nr:inhibitor of growth protein 4-like [Rhopalosiphum padi]